MHLFVLQKQSLDHISLGTIIHSLPKAFRRSSILEKSHRERCLDTKYYNLSSFSLVVVGELVHFHDDRTKKLLLILKCIFKTQTFENWSAYHSSIATSRQLPRFCFHNEVVPYQTFSASFGTISHVEFSVRLCRTQRRQNLVT